jgi:hypothetical protein
MSEVFSNHPGTTLAADITTTVRPVTLTVASAMGLPSTGNFRVLIGDEILLITSISGTSLTGSNAEGTTAATHATGTGVQHILTAGALQQLEADVEAAIAIPLVIGFVMNTGATGTNVGPELIAPRAGALSKCKIVTKASDGSTALTLTIKQNGVSVFSANPTITAGTTAGTITTSTSLTSNPLAVAADDLFTIDITSGSSSWIFTAQLES